MFLVLDVARIIVNVGWASLVIIILILLYNYYLKRIKKTQVDKDAFVDLYPIEKNPAVGEVQFYFVVGSKQHVTLKLYSQLGNTERLLCDAEKPKGGHVIVLDTTELPDGWYFYELITSKQKSTKMMEVKNLS